MTLATYLTYLAACIAIVIVPGPTVTVIIANSIRHGTRAGMMNIAGTQAGLAIMLVILALGLQTIVETMAGVFEIIRFVGAAYLIWLGYKLWQAGGDLGDADSNPVKKGSHFWQGFIVILSNPKALLFFGAFIPQFIDPAGNAITQTLLLGGTFMVVATILDGGYAVLAGRARGLITPARVRLTQRVSGSLLIGGGLWLAFSRR